MNRNINNQYKQKDQQLVSIKKHKHWIWTDISTLNIEQIYQQSTWTKLSTINFEHNYEQSNWKKLSEKKMKKKQIVTINLNRIMNNQFEKKTTINFSTKKSTFDMNKNINN